MNISTENSEDQSAPKIPELVKLAWRLQEQETVQTVVRWPRSTKTCAKITQYEHMHLFWPRADVDAISKVKSSQRQMQS